MKQIVLCLIGILFASFVSAQKINHPSLLYTPQRIQQVKQRMQNEPKLREAWEDIQKTADEALQKEDFNRLDYLSLAYLMTDNKEYANIIKEILKQAYCLKGINNQTEIIPIVTVDTVPIIESALYFDKTNFYTTDLKEADQEFKFLDINLPHVCFYDMPTYIKYLYHEIYHYIVPENREQRNIYMGQFLVSIGYEKLIMGIIECCLRKTENSEKVKEFIFPIVASIISNIYPQIHFDLKSKYKIQTKDVNSVFHTREIYKKVLFKYLQLDIQNWIEKKESKFAEILIALHEHLNKNKIVEGLEHFSYDSLRECISESDIENIEKYLTDSQIIENIGFYLETLLPQINRIFLNIVNGLKEASADIPMIEMTEMSLEEYLNLYILCQKNLLKKIVPPEQPDNKEIFRIIMLKEKSNRY